MLELSVLMSAVTCLTYSNILVSVLIISCYMTHVLNILVSVLMSAVTECLTNMLNILCLYLDLSAVTNIT